MHFLFDANIQRALSLVMAIGSCYVVQHNRYLQPRKPVFTVFADLMYIRTSLSRFQHLEVVYDPHSAASRRALHINDFTQLDEQPLPSAPDHVSL
ncbi:hypothetical protein GDO78_010094 [Eleutherodactylus coqui]|uniref:Uncharacterized protein n=1 Tax=Eleutherodactylus coqui TaxID=57060 RepID=A0A8J6K8D8_ELECQ|nr:hypothetical protein GDO78_010094 [Eleutherodactylus coqui]